MTLPDSNPSKRRIECPECGAVAAPNMAHADYCTRKDLVDELPDRLSVSNPKRPFEHLPYPDADACRRCNGGGIEPGATWRCSLCKGTGLADSNPSKRQAEFPCPRCGSEEWEYCDYGGCSECRPYEERGADGEQEA